VTVDYAALSRVICVANGKGGVSKTSLAANLAGLTAAGGYSTLVVDLDPQGDLSDDLGYFANAEDDHGQALAAALLTGQPLMPTLKGVRPNLDVVCGGDQLTDVVGALMSKANRGQAEMDFLARALAPIADNYELVFVDTPPVDPTLQMVALGAARWVLVPTKADASSIRGIRRIAERVVAVRTVQHPIDVVGVVLTGVPKAASRVRASAARDIVDLVGAAAPLFDATIRASEAAARETRARGLLVHELAELVHGSRPFWEALRDGVSPDRLPGTAPALASDYFHLTEELLKRLSALEGEE
jgi:chromosome partitioning protein